MPDYDIQVRRHTSAGVPREVLPATNITFTTVDGEAAVLTMTVSELMVGDLPTPFYAGVEMLADGRWRSPRNDLFVFHDTDGDEKDPVGMRTLTGVLYVADRAGRHYLPDSVTAEAVVWTNASAGGVMDSLLSIVPGTGIGTSTFTATRDSNGTAWIDVDKTDHAARPWMSVAQVLSMLAQGGYCQWWSQSKELLLARVGSVQDRTSVPIDLAATSVSRRDSTAETATKFYIVTDTDVPTQIVTRPDLGAGPREAIVTVTGAVSKSAAMRMATPIIIASSRVRREYTVMYDAKNLPARPLLDFQLGDLFRVQGSVHPLVGVQVTKAESGITVRLTFGDRFLGLIAKIAKRAAQISFGSLTMSGGSGHPITPGILKPKAEPQAPTGVRVTSNVGGVRNDGAPYALIRVEWDRVTQTVLGADTAVTRYEVWLGEGEASPAPYGETTETFTELELPIAPRRLQVRAFNGSWSVLSPPIELGPAAPAHDATAPTMPILVATAGGVILRWDGALETGPVGPSFSALHAEIAPSLEDDWTDVGATLGQAGQVATIRGVVGTDVYVRYYWVDTSGRRSNPSTIAMVTVTGLTPDDLDSVPDFFANEAVIQNVRAGVLQAGVIEVDMLAPNVGELIDIRANEGVQIITQRVDSLEEAGQYYRFGPDGAIIGRVDDPTTLELRNDGASFNVNGVPATTWGAEGMDVPRMSSDEAVIGNLQFEKSGNRTIVRVVQT